MTEAKQGERKAIFLTPRVFEMFKELANKEKRTYSAQLEIVLEYYKQSWVKE